MNKIIYYLAFGLFLSPTVQAAIIVDKSFDPNNNIIGTYFDVTEGDAGLFDDFSLSSDTNITDITFWASYWASGAIPVSDSLKIRIEQRSGTSRTGLVYDADFNFTKVDTGLDHNNMDHVDIWEFSSVGLDIDLTAGDYWLSFYLTSNAPSINLAWQRSATSAPIGVYSNSNDYNNEYGDYAFVIESNDNSPVPEPTTMLLFGTGIAGLAAVGRKRKK